MRGHITGAVAVVVALGLVAGCGSSSTSGPSAASDAGAGAGDSATSVTANEDSGADGASAAPCTSSDVTQCPIASLSPSQFTAMCAAITKEFEDPAGTVYKCTTTDDAGASESSTFTVPTSDCGTLGAFKGSCSITGAEIVACANAAKASACALNETTGPCGYSNDLSVLAACSSN